MGVCQAWWAEDLRSLENVCALLVCDDEGATYSTRPFLRDRKEKKLSLNLELWRNILESPPSLCGLVSRRAAGYPGLSDIWRWHNAMMPDLVAVLSPPPFFLKKHPFLLFQLIFGCTGASCCVRAFSSCSKWELLFIEVRGFLIAVISLVAKHSSRCTGSAVMKCSWHVESSWSRDRTYSPCVGRSPIHCSTREIPCYVFSEDYDTCNWGLLVFHNLLLPICVWEWKELFFSLIFCWKLCWLLILFSFQKNTSR